MYTVDAENIVYVTFLKEFKGRKAVDSRDKSVTIDQIKCFTEMAQAVIADCHFEASERSIYSAVEQYSNIFEWKNEKITFVEEYIDDFERLEPIFSRRLPNRISKAIGELLSCK